MSGIFSTATRIETARDAASSLARLWWVMPYRLRAKRFPALLASTLRTLRMEWTYGDKRADLAVDSPISAQELIGAAHAIGAPRAMVRLMRAVVSAGVNVRRTVRAVTVCVGAQSDVDGRASFEESAPESAREAVTRARDSRISDLALRVELSADLADTLRRIDLPTLRHLARTLDARNPGLASDVRAFIRETHTGAMALFYSTLDDLAVAVRAKSARPVAAPAFQSPDRIPAATHTTGPTVCDDGGDYARPVCARSPIKSRCRAQA